MDCQDREAEEVPEMSLLVLVERIQAGNQSCEGDKAMNSYDRAKEVYLRPPSTIEVEVKRSFRLDANPFECDFCDKPDQVAIEIGRVESINGYTYNVCDDHADTDWLMEKCLEMARS